MLAHWSRENVTVNGVDLHYYRTGKEGGPPLVLAHGFSDDGQCWYRLATDLEADFDVVMPDARGHGLSARVRPGEKVDLTADLAEIIRALDLGCPIVGGHSMGATVAAELGARHPDLVRALILEDPAWRSAPPPAAEPSQSQRPNDLMHWARSLAEMSVEEIVAQNRPVHPTWPEPVLRAWCEAKTRLDQGFLSAWRPGAMPWQQVVQAISCPTLLITADPDKGGIVTPELAEEACAMNSNLHVAHIPGVGHHIRFENYDPYRAAVMAFLNEHVRPFGTAQEA
jgi:pimeloyl-ACP methyl ester carboxylesterase